MLCREKIMKLIIFGILLLIVFGLQAKNFYSEAAFQTDYANEEFTHKTSLGFEYFRKFSNEYGDYLTANLQVRVPYVINENFPESLTLEIHNAWLEYKAGLGKFIRLGHFAPAFGLESITDTHGSLAQTMAMKNVGFKQDWGIGWHSFIGNFDYVFAAQIGSGMAIRKDGFLFSGRISSPTSNDFQYAFSALYGDVHHSMSMATYPVEKCMGVINKKHIAAELQYNFGAYYFKNELSVGYNDEAQIISNFTEFEYKPFILANFNFIVQSKLFRVDGTDSLNWLTGTSYKFFDALTLSVLYDISDEYIRIKLYYFY
jgi:hypothetical protein